MALKSVQIDTGNPAIDGYRASLTALDDGESISLPYNPESYSVTIAPRWAARNLAGAEKDSLQWTGNGPRVVSFEHELTVQNVWSLVGGVPIQNRANLTAVELVIQTIQGWATRPTLQSQRPTLVRLSMGVYEYVGAITAFSYDRTKENPEGYALVANVRFELTETR